ncbi:hypothetical protein AHAS_Ahas19G0377200 [Arachis hypogaea]
MKLLIDTKGKKVLFAEASKEVVDFLFTLLQLPLATVVKLLTKEVAVGCLGNLYSSVENLNHIYMQSNLSKDLLLSPTVLGPTSPSISCLLPSAAGMITPKLYGCNNNCVSMEQHLLGYEHEMYRLDHVEHIAGRLDRVAPRILRTRQNLMTRPPEQIRPYLRRAEFEYVAYMVEFEHDWSLASALIERWRPESHTFNLPCGEMTITLHDVAYQLGLRIDVDPVSGCICGWEQHHQGPTIEKLCEQILGVVPDPEDRQSQTKWTVKLTWFHNTDATEERLMWYTRGNIMQLIGSILFPDASDFRAHIRWLPLLEDLDTCSQMSWGSAVLA